MSSSTDSGVVTPAAAARPVADLAPAWHARLDLWFAGGALLLMWLFVWNQQRLEWAVNPSYGYGWAVPLLFGYLLYERMKDCPAPRARAHLWLPGLALCAVAVALVPLRVVHEANPDWVRINWLMAGAAMGVTFSLLYAWGGWRWVWHFGFPVLFTFTALPWPVWFEESATQGLMKINAIISAEGLTLCGIPALAQGNTIYIGGTVVDVEEACSGIRSLQTAFMMSLFLGEFYRLAIWRRAALLVLSFVVAFLLNMLRTVTLTFVAGTQGSDALESWHDPMGMVVMFGCIGALWGLAVLIAPKQQKPALLAGPGTTLGGLPRTALAPSLALIVGLVAAEGTTQAWYRYHEARLPDPVRWSMAWPVENPTFIQREFSERSLKLLKYNYGESVSWEDEAGRRWSAFYLRWDPGRVSKFLAGSHYPAVCFPATGLTLEREFGILPFTVGEVTFPFRAYEFSGSGGRPLFAFHGLVEERPSVSGETVDYRQVAANERIASVRAGNRNLGQRVLGITITGAYTLEEAQGLLHSVLPDYIRFENPNQP
jgi:exosortase